MAAPTQAERDEVRDLVRWIYDRSGAQSWSELARRARVLPSSISDWSRGENAPSAYNLVKLMRAAGIIATDAELEPNVPDLRQSFDGRLQDIEAKVSELPTADDLGMAVATLQAAIDRLAIAGSPAVQQAKPARKRGAKVVGHSESSASRLAARVLE